MSTRDRTFIDLAKRITKEQRTFERLAEDCWRRLDIMPAVQYRGVAQGLEQALSFTQEASQRQRFAPARDNHGDRAWITEDGTTLVFSHIDLTGNGYRELFVAVEPEADGAA